MLVDESARRRSVARRNTVSLESRGVLRASGTSAKVFPGPDTRVVLVPSSPLRCGSLIKLGDPLAGSLA